MELTPGQIEILRTRLKKYHGSIKTVAGRVGTTPEWISRMLRGKASLDISVINIALDVCAEFEREEKEKEDLVSRKMAEMNIE